MKLLYILMLLFSTIFSFSDNNMTIIWSDSNFPPARILEGEFKNEGYVQKVNNDLIKYLNKYDHIVEENILKRTLEMLKNKKNVCCANLLYTKEREEFIEYSLPTYMILPYGSIILKSKKHILRDYLTINNQLDLEKILKKGELKVGFIEYKSYGHYIDVIISKYKNNDNVIFLNQNIENIEFFLTQKRVDLIIGLKNETKYYNNKEFVYIPFINSKPILGFIGCSKSPLGKEIIKQLNQFIKQNREKKFLTYYMRWLDEENRNYIKKNAKTFFKNADNK